MQQIGAKHSKPELQDFVKFPFFLYSLAGLKLFKWSPEDRFSLAQCLTALVLTLNVATSFVAKMAFLFFGTIANSQELMLLISIWAYVLNSFAKAITVWIGRGKLKETFMQMKETYPQTEALQEEYRLAAYYKKIRNDNMYLMAFNLGSVALFNLLPIIESLLEYYRMPAERRQFTYRLPYMLFYPFDVDRPVPFAVTYICQCLGGWTTTGLFLGSDFLLLNSVHLMNMHFEFLAKKIREFRPSGSDKDIEVLTTLIAYHRDIMDNCQRVDKTFSVSIFLNYIATGLIMCLMGFQIVAGADKMTMFKLVMFLFTSMIHVLYICRYGNHMIDLSVDISEEFCHHQWYRAGVSYQKMLPLAIARSQKPAFLTAFKFFIVSMETFKTLLTTSYQFFTLLNSSLNE